MFNELLVVFRKQAWSKQEEHTKQASAGGMNHDGDAVVVLAIDHDGILFIS